MNRNDIENTHPDSRKDPINDENTSCARLLRKCSDSGRLATPDSSAPYAIGGGAVTKGSE